MNFQQLYKQIFVEEANETISKEVANPEDFDDVAPLPLPEPPPAGEVAASSVATGTTLTEYIIQIEDFAGKLNSTDGQSLQSLVSSLDIKDTPFEGIYARTSLDILNAAKTLREVAETLKNFIVHAAKK